MDTTDQPRVALLGHGYWGPNLARLHLRLGRGWVADPDIDALVVAFSGRTHAPLAADALVAGKHVPASCRYPALQGLPSEDSSAEVLGGPTPGTMMLSVRSSPASNPPATKPHIATACLVSLRCHPPVDQR